jgi:MFS family permease
VTEVSADLRRARVAVMAAFAIQGLTFASIVTRLPTFKDRLGLDDTDVLVILAVVAVMSAVGSLVAGSAAQRWGSAVVLRVVLVGVSVGVLLSSYAESELALVVTTGFYGVFVGAVDAASNMQGVAVQDRYGRSIMTGFHATWSAAAVVGAAYASLTIALDWSLPWSLGLVALAGLVLNAATTRSLLVDVGTTDALVEPQASVVEPVEIRTEPPVRVPWLPVLLIGLPTFAMWLADSATSVWSGIYLEDGLDVSAEVAPIAFGAYQAVLLVVRLVGDRIVGRFGPATTIRVSGVVATVALVLIVLAPSVPVVMLGFGLLGGGLGLVPPLSFVAAAHIDLRGSQVAVARVNVSNYLGYLVAAFAIALVAETIGHRAMFVVPLVFIPLIVVMADQFTPRSAAPSAAQRPAAERS